MTEAINTIPKYPYVGPHLHASFSPSATGPKVPKVATHLPLGYDIFTLYMTVRYHDRGWHMSELADGEANLVCCDVPGNQRRAAGV